VDVPTGNILVEKNDVLGLETGLDMVHGRGPATPGPALLFPRSTAVDHDVDPTLVWIEEATAVPEDEAALGRPGPSMALLHPNPFRPHQSLAFRLSRPGDVQMEIFDVAGTRVRRLFGGPRLAGVHREVWDGRDERGTRVATGIYFLVLRGPSGSARSKVLLVQ
jgi:hypothetical protein